MIHVLNQADGFERYRFAAGVGPGDNQYALLGIQIQAEGYYAFALLLKRQMQERVPRRAPVYVGSVLKLGIDGIHL